MADFFNKALGYFGSGGTGQDNDFVGQYVELGDQKLRVRRVIAEGLNALVYLHSTVTSDKCTSSA